MTDQPTSLRFRPSYRPDAAPTRPLADRARPQTAREHYELFRRDAARWIEPEEVAPVAEITPRVALRLLYQHPPLRAMAWLRFGTFCRTRGIRGVSGYVQRRLLRVHGLEIAPRTPIGGGLYVAHPVGCVLHAESIGENVTIAGQVTLGARNDDRYATIGDRVNVGVGARVLGGIHVGAEARVGANAVVVDDVPAGATVVGIPARVVTRAPLAASG